ncbi:MAG TPA: hypothetical protein VIL74_02830 [Pyrinomonadaceae bacterium]|jgi:hypothetical protein
MKNFSLRMPHLFTDNAFQVAVTFLASGFLAGAFFNWLVCSPALEEFFFVPYSARQARFGWYVASGLTLAFGLAVGFLVSSHKIDFREKLGLTLTRSLLSFALVSLSVPLLRLATGDYGARLLGRYSLAFLMWWVFPPVTAAAMCVLTKSLRRLPAALLASAIFATGGSALAFPVMLFLFWLFDEPSQTVLDFAAWTLLYSSLSLSCGWWLLGRAGSGK